ncbi:hypothetical protein FGX01_03700, partial [Xylella fastidiosa subsp. multiplex]|nr:hypothetical protein [Xylella fastidiosa subsp. multiplex]
MAAVQAGARDGGEQSAPRRQRAAVHRRSLREALRQQMPYDALDDFEPLCLGGHSIVVLVTQPGFAARDVAQLIAL